MYYGLHPNSRAARRLDAQRRQMREGLLSRGRRLYLSFCEDDLAWCRPFSGALRQAGADVWFDEAHVGSGSKINGIERELYRWAQVFILSPAATACTRMRDEAETAASIWKHQLWMHLVLPIVAETTATEPEQLRRFAHIAGPEGVGLAPEVSAMRIGYILALDDPLGRPLGEEPPPHPPGITAEDAYMRGRVLYGPGTRIDALRAWDLAVRLNPTNPRYWRDRGETLHRLKRFDEARASLDRSLELDPSCSGAWRILASVLEYQGEFIAALDAAEHAIAIDGHLNAWGAKVRVLRRLGRTADVDAALIRLREAFDMRRYRNHTDAQ